MSVGLNLVGLAATQGGYVTRAQLVEMGLSISAIDWKVRCGDIKPITDGVYQVFPTNDHTDLVRGALLALPDAVVTHESAAHVLRFPRLPAWRPTVTVASHTTHSFPGVKVRRSDDIKRSHMTKVDGILVTNVPRTAFDLARVLKFDQFEAVTDALVLNGRMTEEQFERVTSELSRRGKPGSRAAKEFLTRRSGAHPGSTVIERRGRAVITAARLPAPVPQFPIPWEPDRRFDDAYPAGRLAIEWDSRAWHLQRTAMEADRRRDRVAASHGWTVVRFTWHDIEERPSEIVSTLAKLLEARDASLETTRPL